MTGPGDRCRICQSADISAAGTVEYVRGYPAVVRDCRTCGCRFTDPADLFDRFHETASLSYYASYQQLERDCLALFARGELAGLRALLSRTAKYRAVLEWLDQAPADARILEVGSSRGYLTAASILAGRDIVGVDTSSSAVAAARSSFGDRFFAEVGSPALADRAPFDRIYHVGLIGCVADPVGLTRDLLAQLKPGGKLLFNAPNRGALSLRDQVWFDSAPPPDLVTLFPVGFWKRAVDGAADVREQVEWVSPMEATSIALRRLLRQRWSPPSPQPLTDSYAIPQGFRPSRIYQLFAAAVTKVAARTGLDRFAPGTPAEFGLVVEMTRTA